MSGNIDALIAGFPGTIQENALRQAQTQVAGQTYAQNALKLQQQLAAQNALRNIYANPANVDPNTGLPRPNALGQLIPVDPAMGVGFAESAGRLQDAQTRAALTNAQLQTLGPLRSAQIENLQSEAADRDQAVALRQREAMERTTERQWKTNLYWTNIYRENVVDPLVKYDHSLPAGLPSETRDQLLATRRAELEKNTIAQFGPPEEIQQRWSYLTKYGPAWESGSVLLQKHLEAMAKRPPESGMETWTEGGNPKSATFDIDMWGNKVDPGTREPYVYHGGTITYNKTGAGAAREPALGTGATYRVPDPNNPGKTIPMFLFPPKRAGDPWLKADQTPYTGSVAGISKIEPGASDAPGSGMSKQAIAYVAERERLAEHMSAPGWAGARYIPGMAENDIRSSLGLPEDATVTVNDARMAALNDVVTRSEIHSNRMALNVISRQNALVQSFEKTALYNANLVDQLGPRGVGSGVMLWNRFQNASRRQIQIDPDLTALDNALTDFKNEYVKIMSTSAGQGGMTSDQARAEGDRLFNVNQPWAVMRKALDVARQTMRNRVTSIHDDWDATVKAIRGKGAFPEQLEPSPAEGTMQPARRESYPASAAAMRQPETQPLVKKGLTGVYVRKGNRIVPAKQDASGAWVPE